MSFSILPPHFDPETGEAVFFYRLGPHAFTERLVFPEDGRDNAAAAQPAFVRLLDLAAVVLGVSYYKLRAPLLIDASALSFTAAEHDFLLDVYENGLGEFYARNGLKRFGRLKLSHREDGASATAPKLPARTLLPIGGGKDSLVSLDLLTRAGVPLRPFAVNPKGPILASAERVGLPLIAVSRTLDPEMIALGREPGYYNGHVPSTAIVSMIAALAALLYGFDRIVLSNERSASEGNIAFDGREANHQYSKSLDFEARIRAVLRDATGGALDYFSLLRPFSEARIGRLFARTTRFDQAFSSCNANFRLAGHTGPLWCGKCPKCLFVFLILAPAMPRERLVAIFGRNVLDNPEAVAPYRELTGLAGHKPWECVGEILEAAACLFHLSADPEWREAAVVQALTPDLVAFYGVPKLKDAFAALFEDSAEHLIPTALWQEIAPHVH